jgi:CRP/FNR family cyclic AMP-dependent transcriptional regulator
MDARHFMKGEVLFEEGKKDDRAYIIRKGEVILSRQTHDGWSKQVAVIEAGGIIGEMAMIDNSPHSVTATATEDGEAMILTREDYLGRLQKTDKVLAMMIKTLTKRLRSTY